MRDSFKRIEAYIDNVFYALDLLKKKKDVYKKYSRLLEQAELYAKDAEYYLREKKDLVTALACIAYAEGLIDSLRYLGVTEIEWKPLSSLLARKKVLVAGSFEIIHPGHIHYIREAWRRGRVYVVVARDNSIRKFKKRDPIIPEEQRLRVVSEIRYVYKAILGDEEDYLKPVEEVKPDLILLGPDQWPSEEKLAIELKRRGVEASIERLSSRVDEELYSTSRIISEIKKRYCGSS